MSEKKITDAAYLIVALTNTGKLMLQRWHHPHKPGAYEVYRKHLLHYGFSFALMDGSDESRRQVGWSLGRHIDDLIVFKVRPTDYYELIVTDAPRKEPTTHDTTATTAPSSF